MHPRHPGCFDACLEHYSCEAFARCTILVASCLIFGCVTYMHRNDVPGFRAWLACQVVVLCDLIPEICNEEVRVRAAIEVALPLTLSAFGLMLLNSGTAEDFSWALVCGGITNLFERFARVLICNPSYRNTCFDMLNACGSWSNSRTQMRTPLLQAH